MKKIYIDKKKINKLIVYTVFAIVFFIFPCKKAYAADIICLPACTNFFDGKKVYSDDFTLSLDISQDYDAKNVFFEASGAECVNTGENTYLIKGEGIIRLILTIIREDNETETYEEWVIVDKTAPVIDVSFHGDDMKRTMYFSFSDLTLDYGSLLVTVNNETINYDVPDANTMDFSLEFEGNGYFEGFIRICDKAGHESRYEIERFSLGNEETYETIVNEPVNDKREKEDTIQSVLKEEDEEEDEEEVSIQVSHVIKKVYMKENGRGVWLTVKREDLDKNENAAGNNEEKLEEYGNEGKKAFVSRENKKRVAIMLSVTFTVFGFLRLARRK